MVDYYQILGVAPDASPEEIRKGYRARANRWHPDKWATEPELDRKAATARFRLVLEANEHLGDPDKRRTYDEKRGTRTARSSKASADPGAETVEISSYAAEVARELREAIENAANATSPARRRYWRTKAESWERSLDPIISMLNNPAAGKSLPQAEPRPRSRRSARANRRRRDRSILVLAAAIVVTAVVSVIVARATSPSSSPTVIPDTAGPSPRDSKTVTEATARQ